MKKKTFRFEYVGTDGTSDVRFYEFDSTREACQRAIDYVWRRKFRTGVAVSTMLGDYAHEVMRFNLAGVE